MDCLTVTLLVDNTPAPGFLPEFGLSLLLDLNGRKILFDTGAGKALLPNLQAAGITPSMLPDVILSHGHYDHTGGLTSLSPQRIWCAPGIAEPHFSYHADGSVHDISMPADAAEVLKKSRIGEIRSFQEILPGIWLTGPIPRTSGEDCGGNFYRESECRTPDTVPEEQALLTAGGTLISGCCHAGIINTLQYCRERHPEIAIHTVIGGLHLRSASSERLQKTADFLRKSGVQTLYLFHCTGENAVADLQRLLPGCTLTSPVPGETWLIR